MTWFAELLPLFLVRWCAMHDCERYSMLPCDTPLVYVCPRRGVFIVDWERTIAEREKAKESEPAP